MLRYKTKTRPDSVSLYDIRPGNGAGVFLQPLSSHRALQSNPTNYQQTNTKLFTDRIPFMLPNQQCQIIEGNYS